MSEIPFVNLLGDELERAAKREQRQPERSRRRRRFTLFAVAGALLVSGTALATGLFSDSAEHQATGSIACYDGADPDFSGSVAVLPQQAGSADVSPVAMCRRELALAKRKVGPLVACSTPNSVAVIPGRNSSDCTAAGFAPLDPKYLPARVRAARLERRILGIEASADCIAPADLSRQVQRVLDRTGWAGWTTQVRSDLDDGPCGSVSGIGGDGNRYISGALDADERRVFVFRGASRRVTDLLYSANASLLTLLFRESGANCLTFAGLRERARQLFGAEGIDVAARSTRVPAGTSLDDDDGRWTRYQAGCAVLAGGEPGRDRNSVEIEVFVRG